MISRKESQIAQILYLRKILRRSNCCSGIQTIGKFGIGITKFELCSNFKGPIQFKNIQTILKGTDSKKSYCIERNQFSQKKVDLIEKNSFLSYVQQIKEHELIISGEFNQDNQFIILSGNKKASQFQMQ